MNELNDRWTKAEAVQEWCLDARGVSKMNSPKGMASLAKQLAGDDLVVKQGWRVVKIEKNTEEDLLKIGKWKVFFENQDPVHADTIVLTCPLPQSLGWG
jgi:predicted NAD/FAD-dependent oxidoreductase